jgi:hypothetical protein
MVDNIQDLILRNDLDKKCSEDNPFIDFQEHLFLRNKEDVINSG